MFDMKCHKCNKNFYSLTYLLNHYTLTHYRSRLSLKFAKALKTNCCSICNKKNETADINKMLRHIGVTHRRVLSSLPRHVSSQLCDIPLKKSEPKVREKFLLSQVKLPKSKVGSSLEVKSSGKSRDECKKTQDLVPEKEIDATKQTQKMTEIKTKCRVPQQSSYHTASTSYLRSKSKPKNETS